jgi:hypothetical protein
MSTITGQLSFFFENPKKFSVNLMAERKFAMGFMGYLTGSLSLFIWQYLSKGGITAVEFIFMFAAAFSFNVLVGIVLASIINLFMDLTATPGSASGAFIVLGVADFVKTLLVPCAILLHAFSLSGVFGGIVFFFVLLFQLIFTIYLLRYSYNCSILKAWIAYAMPYLVGIFVFFMFVASAVISLLANL